MLGLASRVLSGGAESAAIWATRSTVRPPTTTHGAVVIDLGPFNTDPVGGQGTRLCVSDQEVRIYVFPNADQRIAVAQAIDHADPSKIGIGLIIEWAGNPKFWQRNLILVLYLGSDTFAEPRLASGRRHDGHPAWPFRAFPWNQHACARGAGVATQTLGEGRPENRGEARRGDSHIDTRRDARQRATVSSRHRSPAQSMR